MDSTCLRWSYSPHVTLLQNIRTNFLPGYPFRDDSGWISVVTPYTLSSSIEEQGFWNIQYDSIHRKTSDALT